MHKFAPASFPLRGSALLQRLDFSIELSGAREKFKELISQIRFLEPVPSQKRFPGGFVVGFASTVSGKKITHKDRIVRESLVRIQVQAKVHLRSAADEGLKIVFQLTALEDAHGVLRKLLKLGILSLAQIKPRQLVIPGAVWKTGYRAAINLLLLHAEPVLVQENCQPFVQAGIIRVVVQLAPKHGQRLRNLFQLDKTCQVPFENTRVFRRACAGLR